MTWWAKVRQACVCTLERILQGLSFLERVVWRGASTALRAGGPRTLLA